MGSERPKRIAFSLDKLVAPGWTAGAQYLENLFLSLRSLDPLVRPEIVALVSKSTSPTLYEGLIPYIDEIVHPTGVPVQLRALRKIASGVQNGLKIEFSSAFQLVLDSFWARNQIDVLFLPNSLHRTLPIPQLSWITDFQHVRLPEMFSQSEINKRNSDFTQTATYSDRVIVSSHDALKDFKEFIPYFADKGRVVQFLARIPEEIYERDPLSVCEFYHLPDRFIYLPNQFWKHKNHQLLIEAMCLVKDIQPDVTVVCSGHTYDYRDPLYFSQLLANVSSRGLRGNLIILGMIPHDHLLLLMRQSLAVLQLSLFEGWSTTVEEAKSLGKGILLSDIPVHREQARPPLHATFFDPHNPESLAAYLVQIYKETSPGPDLSLETAARDTLPARIAAFGEAFLEVASEAMSSKR